MTRIIPTLLVALALFIVFIGCAREIGDACETSVDCDVQNKRICDLSQPGGYCTIRGCEKGTCPDEAVCIMFRPEPERLAKSWCMYACDDKGDCRGGYSCLSTDDLGDYLGEIETNYTIDDDAGVEQEDHSQSSPLARNLDRESAKFCTVKPVSREN